MANSDHLTGALSESASPGTRGESCRSLFRRSNWPSATAVVISAHLSYRCSLTQVRGSHVLDGAAELNTDTRGKEMANKNPRVGNIDSKTRPKAELSVSVAMESVSKLPHEHDESVESQVGGPRPGTVNSNSAPGIKSRVKKRTS